MGILESTTHEINSMFVMRGDAILSVLMTRDERWLLDEEPTQGETVVATPFHAFTADCMLTDTRTTCFAYHHLIGMAHCDIEYYLIPPDHTDACLVVCGYSAACFRFIARTTRLYASDPVPYNDLRLILNQCTSLIHEIWLHGIIFQYLHSHVTPPQLDRRGRENLVRRSKSFEIRHVLNEKRVRGAQTMSSSFQVD